MPSIFPRVQVTVDAELEAALAGIDPKPTSRSRLIRDLALRGAQSAREERARRREAIDGLVAIARGETAYDPASAAAAHAEREAG